MAVLAFGAGFLFAKNNLQKRFMAEEKEENAAEIPESSLRTTRSKNPTIAQQMVNIMNYNGESQLEEGYE